MSTGLSQEDQTLAMLRAAGERGVHTFEMRKAFIGNPSERIGRLRKRGHVISASDKEQLRGEAWGVRYFLTFDAEEASLLPTPREGGKTSMTDAASTQARGCPGAAVAAVSRDDGVLAGRASGAQLIGPNGAPVERTSPADAAGRLVDSAAEVGVIAPVRDAVSLAGSRSVGALFDPDAYRRAA